MFTLILSAFYVFLPAYVANMAPVIAGALGLPLGRPMSESLLGAGKTWRGVYAAYLGALATLLAQRWLQGTFLSDPLHLLDYRSINVALYALLFGIGAIVGDVIKSFFKRRLHMPRGSAWVPFDQLDFVVGALVFLAPVVWIGWGRVAVLLVATPLLHLLTNVIGFGLRWKREWW